MSETKKKFGIRLYQLRNEAGMTQAKLAEKANLSIDLISRIERGDRAPSLESIEKISLALNVSPLQLFNFDNQEIKTLADAPSEVLELWKILQGKRSKQVRLITDIARILLR
jgi:transcriptional regulator with XRE-family HTH domain